MILLAPILAFAAPSLVLPARPLAAVPRARPTACQDDPLLERHLLHTYHERRAAFEAAWDAAGEAARRRVTALVEARGRSGLPALYHLSAEDLTELTDVLEGAADGPQELPLARRVAESLDLRLRPGAFSAARGVRGEPVVARVLPLYTRLLAERLPEWIEVGLVWVGPDGREVVGRREPVHRDALVLPGFEMYVSAPASEPGAWRLVPELEVDGEAGRGRGVPVECVAELTARYQRLTATPAGDANDRARRRALELAVVEGLREIPRPSIEALLAGAAPPTLAPRLAGPDEPDDVPATYRLAPPDGTRVRWRVVVAVGRLEDPGWELCGPRGEAWRALAADAAAEVLITGRAVHDPAGPDALALCVELARGEPLATVLVVAGSDFGRLQAALAGRDGEPPYQRLVVDTVVMGDAVPRPRADVPTLVFEPLESAAPRERLPATGDGPPVDWVRVAEPPLVARRALPGAIAAWLAGGE